MDPSHSSPLYALANAHFLLAGPILGLVGAGLVWMRGARGWRPLAWLVTGKTLSTWVLVFPLSVAGAGLLPRLLGRDPLGRLPWLYLGFGLLLLLASGILEWPFFHRALGARPSISRGRAGRAAERGKEGDEGLGGSKDEEPDAASRPLPPQPEGLSAKGLLALSARSDDEPASPLTRLRAIKPFALNAAPGEYLDGLLVPRNGRAALGLSFRANAVCLLVLAALYLPCCSLGLLEVPRWNGIAAAGEAGTQVFYLREGALRTRGLSGPERCLDPEVPHGAEARLFARRGEGGWDLWLQERDKAPRMVQRGVAPSQAEAPAQPALHIKLQKTTRTVEPALPETHGKPAEGLRAEDSDWALHLGEWPWQGLRVESRDLRGGYRLALDTPLLSWEARCATRLPGERLLFQMGPYLWLLELETRRLRLFAKGQGAQVVRMSGNEVSD